MKNELRAEYKCVKCKVIKSFHLFSIHYTGDWDGAFVKRVCKSCDSNSLTSQPEEQKSIQQEVQRKLRSIARLEQQLSDLKLSAQELQAQLKCAKKSRISIPEDDNNQTVFSE